MKTDKEKPVILAILDGWGIRKETAGNAVALAKTPNMKYLLANYPNEGGHLFNIDFIRENHKCIFIHKTFN